MQQAGGDSAWEHRRDYLFLASLFWFSRLALAWRQEEKRKPKRFHRQSRRKSHNQDRRIERKEDALPSVSRSASSQSCYPFFWRFARAAFISGSLNRAGSGSGGRLHAAHRPRRAGPLAGGFARSLKKDAFRNLESPEKRFSAGRRRRSESFKGEAVRVFLPLRGC